MIRNIIYLIPLIFMSSFISKDKNFEDYVEAEIPYLKELYIDIHKNPEISLMEKETSKKLANELRKVGFDVEENFGGYGVVGILKNGDGPTILYRTDMDALPMEEKTGLPYASKVITKNFDGNDVGTMHSCGHDMHMTVWTGTARALVERKDEWNGTVMMIGQPAEEIGAGAAMMLSAGLYEKFPVPDYGIALHSSPTIPSGKVGFGKGYIMANTESVDIKVFGQGSHGAAPHMSIDPIVTASMIVMELQTIVSRNLNPLDDAVITVGSIRGGTKHNIIPDEVNLQLTIRTYKEEVRNLIHKRIKEMCDAHDKSYYKKFSKNCDEYFYLPHRNEARGDGGIFYDYLSSTSWDNDFNFTKDVGSCFLDTVKEIITMDLNKKWKKNHKEQQKIKRGRYVEFNLLYDRGTKFGLQTDGNIDAILMSMPPEAKWN